MCNLAFFPFFHLLTTFYNLTSPRDLLNIPIHIFLIFLEYFRLENSFFYNLAFQRHSQNRVLLHHTTNQQKLPSPLETHCIIFTHTCKTKINLPCPLSSSSSFSFSFSSSLSSLYLFFLHLYLHLYLFFSLYLSHSFFIMFSIIFASSKRTQDYPFHFFSNSLLNQGHRPILAHFQLSFKDIGLSLKNTSSPQYLQLLLLPSLEYPS